MTASPEPSFAAGAFAAWLEAFMSVLDPDDPCVDMEVPCGDCNACCRASLFIHVAIDEPAAKAIPQPLLFPAPASPDSAHLVMGFSEQGCCPMLEPPQEAGECTIYAHRPTTCRSFDCRIFAATGIYPSEPNKQALTNRARQWSFELSSRKDQDAKHAVEAAGHYLDTHATALSEVLPRGETQRALATLRIYSLFLPANLPSSEGASGTPDLLFQEVQQRLEVAFQSSRPSHL